MLKTIPDNGGNWSYDLWFDSRMYTVPTELYLQYFSNLSYIYLIFLLLFTADTDMNQT